MGRVDQTRTMGSEKGSDGNWLCRHMMAATCVVICSMLPFVAQPSHAQAPTFHNVAGDGEGFCTAQGYEIATYSDAVTYNAEACAVIPTWGISRIAGPGKIDGSGYGCHVTAFSPDGTGETLCKEGASLIELLNFSVSQASSGAKIEWTTGSEVDTIGFNIWHAETEDGEYALITDSRIPSQGGPEQGASYEYIDDGCPGPRCCYKLADIDVDLVNSMHGPVCVEQALPLFCGTSAISGGINHAAWFLLPLAALTWWTRRTRCFQSVRP